MKKLLACKIRGFDSRKCKEKATIFVTSLSGSRVKYYCYSHATIVLDYILPLEVLIVTVPEGIFKDELPIIVDVIREVYKCKRFCGRKGGIYFRNSDEVTFETYDKKYIEILDRKRCILCGKFCKPGYKFCKEHNILISIIRHRFKMLSELNVERYERNKREFLESEDEIICKIIFPKE